MASERRWNVPASTRPPQSRSYSSAEPSHQWIDWGLVRAAISSTQLVRASFFVGASGAAVASVIVGLLNSYLGICTLGAARGRRIDGYAVRRGWLHCAA